MGVVGICWAPVVAAAVGAAATVPSLRLSPVPLATVEIAEAAAVVAPPTGDSKDSNY